MEQTYTTFQKIEIITRPSKFEALREALYDIGVFGLTAYEVLGAGKQKGELKTYRGAEYSEKMHRKIKLEVVVCDTPVQRVIDKAIEICRTGETGDGKIFVYPIEEIVRIRTGDTGHAAIN